MTCFNGFQSMNNYFMEYDNRDKQIYEREKEISEQLKVSETERNKIESKFNEMIEKIKEKEIELIQNIEEKSIELELENTGKIQCDGHTHKTVKNYHKCLTKNKKQYTQVTQLVYFMDIDDETFDDKLKVFFNLFPEKMKKKIDPEIRYERYKSYYNKTKMIENLVLTKLENYEKILQILRNKYEIKDSDFESSDEEDELEGSENPQDVDDSEADDMEKMTILTNKIKVCKKTQIAESESDNNESDGELVYNIK